MKHPRLQDTTNENHLDFVGDNLAINFINTRRMVDGQLTDTLQSDGDVKAWLKRLQVPIAKGTLPFNDGVLLQKARALREIALSAVRERKSGNKSSFLAIGQVMEAVGRDKKVIAGPLPLRASWRHRQLRGRERRDPGRNHDGAPEARPAARARHSMPCSFSFASSVL